jgi:dipeptidyl aminopeptidase/acylaminoacyl peptidase
MLYGMTRARVGATLRLFAALGVLAAGCGARAAAPAPARSPVAVEAQNFTGDPAIGHVLISPSGKYLAWVRSDGLFDELVVEDLATGKLKPTIQTKHFAEAGADHERRQHIAYVHWKSDDYLLVTVDVPAASIYTKRVVSGVAVHFVINRQTLKAVPLNLGTPNNRGALSDRYIIDALPNDPDHVLVGTEKGGVDRVDVHNGARTPLEDGGPHVLSYGVNRRGVIDTRVLIAGSTYFPYLMLQARAPGETVWTPLWELHQADFRAMQDIDILGAAVKPDEVYVRYRPATKADGDVYSIRTYNLRTKTLGPVIWSHPKYDVDSVVVDEASGAFLGACYVEDVEICRISDAKLDARLKAIAKFFEGRANIDIASRSDDDGKWVLRVTSPEEPTSYYLFDVAAQKIDPIGGAWPRMQAAGVGVVRRLDYRARDGFALTAYVTTPPGKGPHPLVVMPHGGPEARDSLGFDTFAQFLASRGYQVLQPNFRGSSGFGVAFAEAGYGQWGGLMQDDVTDAVKALVAGGEVDAKRICIVGASYGGYAALYGAATQGDLYRCAVSIDGVADLFDTLAEDRTKYGSDSLAYKYDLKAIGDPGRDVERLRAKSPTRLAAAISIPVLLIHGTDDEVVSVEQARKMKRALEGAKKSVRYVEIKYMGHGPALDRETQQVLTEMGTFLDANIGPAAPGAEAPAAGRAGLSGSAPSPKATPLN